MITTPWGVYWHILSTLTCILFVLTGCGGSSGESGDAAARTSRLSLALNTTSTTSRTADSGAPRQAQPGDVDFVTRLTVRITAADITPIVARFPVAANQQEVVRVDLPGVPTGRQRQIAVTAFNASNIAVFRGATTRDLIQAVETVALTLSRITPPQPDNRPPVPTAPNIVAGSSPSQEAGPNTPGTSQILVNDPDEGQTHTFAVTTPPPSAHGTAVVNNTGLVTYTPAHGFVGEDRFTVTVTDNGTPPLSGQVTITAEACSNQLPPPDPEQPLPVINTDLNTPGMTRIQIVSPRPFVLTADIISDPPHGTATTSVEGGNTVRVTYTPDPDFLGLDRVEVTATATFTDGGCPPLQRRVFMVDVTVGLRDVNDLIAAIEAANASTGEVPPTLNLRPGLYTLTAVHNITAGANGLPSITANMRLVGSNAATTIIERDPTAPPFRILHVANSSHTEVIGITLRGGNAVAPAMPENLQRGGGLFNEGSAILQDVIVTGNQATSGGGIAVAQTAFLEVTNSTIQSNTATLNGGGLFFTLDGTAQFTARILSSTISGNTAAMHGGGLANTASGVVNLHNSTVSGNQAGQSGGGLHNSPDSILALVSSTITNNTANSDNDGTGAGGGLAQESTVDSDNASTLLLTIIAGNTVRAGNGPDCAGPVFSHGFNLIRAPGGCTISGSQIGDIRQQNPLLGPLQPNGGPTETHALLPGSPAIDGGNNESCGSSDATDQRGESRLVDGDGDNIVVCDIGAYERQSTDAQ